MAIKPPVKKTVIHQKPNPEAHPRVRQVGLKGASEIKRPFRGRAHNPDPSELQRMRQKGMSYPAIARLHGCDHTTVMWWFRRFGLDQTKGQPSK